MAFNAVALGFEPDFSGAAAHGARKCRAGLFSLVEFWHVKLLVIAGLLETQSPKHASLSNNGSGLSHIGQTEQLNTVPSLLMPSAEGSMCKSPLLSLLLEARTPEVCSLQTSNNARCVLKQVFVKSRQ